MPWPGGLPQRNNPAEEPLEVVLRIDSGLLRNATKGIASIALDRDHSLVSLTHYRPD